MAKHFGIGRKMNRAYDKYYQTENLFGEPYDKLLEFFANHGERGKVLDLGCGQGRDAIPLARLGYAVTGIDNSKVGIDQMNKIAQSENLNLIGLLGDIYSFEDFNSFDIILLDSMFHFAKKDRDREVGFLKNILQKIRQGSLLVVCIQDTGNKVQILNEVIDFCGKLRRVADKKFKYKFEDKESGHQSQSDYRMIIVEK